MILARPVKPRASRTALMVASVPEFTNRTRSTGATRSDDLGGQLGLGRGRRAERQPVAQRPVATASTTAGCAWPRIIGPHEQTRST